MIFNIKGSPHREKCYVKLIQSFDWSKKGVDQLKVMLKVKFKGFILTLIETLWFLFLTLDLWVSANIKFMKWPILGVNQGSTDRKVEKTCTMVHSVKHSTEIFDLIL